MAFGDALRYSVGLDFTSADRQLQAFKQRASSIGASIGSIASAATAVGATLGAGLAAGALGLKSILDAGSEMEAFESRLTTLMGSSSQAKERMAELFDFAAKTPFEVGPIVSAETTLRGFGAAAEELMPGLIDFAAVTGTDLPQAAIDFGKAWNTGATGLESDGGKILRKQIELREGLDATKMSIEDFRAAMLETLNEGMFAGGADRLSKTFSGMVSNLSDEWGRFKLTVADAGVFNNVKGVLEVTLGLIGDNRAETQRLAEVVSGVLWSSFKGVAYTMATMVDIGRGVYGSMLLASEGAAKFISFTADGLAGIDRRIADIFERLGAGGVAEGYRQAALGLEDMAGKADAFGVSAAAQGEELRKTVSSVADLVTLFAEAEEAAKNYGAVAEDAAKNPTGSGAGGAGGGGAGTKKDPEDDFYERLVASQMFLDEMKALNRNELQQEQALYAERMDELLKFHEEGLIAGNAFASARLSIEQAYTDAVSEMRAEAAEADKQRREQYVMTVIGETQSLLGTIGALFDQSNAEQKAAYKAFALADIAISTAMGIQKAMAQFGFPAGLVPAGLITASGVAQAAAVLKAHQGSSGMGEHVVYAHQGGPSGPTPGERDVRVLNTEAMLNSQVTRALGPQGVEAMNSGRMPSTTVNLNIGRVAQREVIRGELRGGESQLRRYVGDLVGSAELAAGFSGARAVA